MRNAEASRLDVEALDALLPLHMRLTVDGRIVGVGRTLRKLFQETELAGAQFFAHFDVIKPRGIRDIAGLAATNGALLRVRSSDGTALELRGMAVATEDDGGLILSFSLGTKMAQLVQKYQLKGQDFAPSDSSVELLYMIETQSAVLSDSKALADRLQRAKIEAEKLALTDSLTGLPNRRALVSHLEAGLTGPLRWEGSFAVLHADLDGFKTVNDTLGHAAGDAVLTHVAATFRATLGEADYIARIGGDEFVIVIGDNPTQARVEHLSNRLIEAASVPIPFGNQMCRIGASIGAIICEPGCQTGPGKLLQDSDLALYEAKRAGRGRVRFFSQQMRSTFDEVNKLSAEIRTALQRDEFEPFFQPQIDTSTGALFGFEALARWCHPQRGTLTPNEFLYVADQANLLERIDDVVLDKSLRALRCWRDAGLAVPKVSLNITASRLATESFVDMLSWACDGAGVTPESVAVEILESVLLDGETNHLVQQIKTLGRCGFRVDLDDFGTGHASISNLRRFSVDVVKIDRSFVTGIAEDPELRKITGAIVGLIRSLDVRPLAEGVENDAEIEILEGLGCTTFQGFAIAKPMPFTEASDWMQRQAPTLLSAPRIAAAS